MAHKDPRLGQIVYILVFYNISFSWLLPLDGFQFIFFVAWQWKRSIITVGNSTARNFFWLQFVRGIAYRSWSWGKSPALALNKSLVGKTRNQYQYFFTFNIKHAPQNTCNEKKNSKELRYFRLPPNLAHRKLIGLANYVPSFSPHRVLSFTQQFFKNLKTCRSFSDGFCEEWKLVSTNLNQIQVK